MSSFWTEMTEAKLMETAETTFYSNFVNRSHLCLNPRYTQIHSSRATVFNFL